MDPGSYQNNDIEYARAVRRIRSDIKTGLKTGGTTLQELFEDHENYKKYIANMKVIEVVSTLPGIGRVKAERILKRMNISFCKKIGGMGKKQKREFFKYFNIQGS